MSIGQIIKGKSYITEYSDTVYVYEKDNKLHTALSFLSFENFKLTIYKSMYDEVSHLSLRLNFNSDIDLLRFNTCIMFDECNESYIEYGIIGVMIKNGFSSTTKTKHDTFKNSITLIFDKFKMNTLKDISQFEITNIDTRETHNIKLNQSDRERLNSIVQFFNIMKV
jgi:hypothetical protein